MQSDSYPWSVRKWHLISSIRSIPYTIQDFLMARMSNIKLIKYSALWQVGEWVGGKKEFDLPLYTLNYKTNMIFKDI
jgi:hypothetical protein